jgi:hypothetical protein
MEITRRVVWDFPQPVRTAQTDTTGTFAGSIVCRGPMSQKSAPDPIARDAWCITVSWETSLYANTTTWASWRAMSCASSASGWIGMPSG